MEKMLINKGFIKILNSRIRIFSIEEYERFDDTRIDIYCNNRKMTAYIFPTKEEADSAIEVLDDLLLLYHRV